MWEPLCQLPFSNRAVLDNDQTTLQVRLVSLRLSEEISKIITHGGNVIAEVSLHTQSHKCSSRKLRPLQADFKSVLPDTIPRAHSPLVRGGKGEKKPKQKPKQEEKDFFLNNPNEPNTWKFHTGFLSSTVSFSFHFCSKSQLIYTLFRQSSYLLALYFPLSRFNWCFFLDKERNI